MVKTSQVIAVIIVVILAIGLIVGYLYFYTSVFKPASTTKNVTFLFYFINPGPQVPYYAAQAEGYFAQEGLNVTFAVAQGSVAVVSSVSSGSADLGYALYSSLVVGASKGEQAKAVAMVMEGNPEGVACFCTLSSPASMQGKSFGTFAGDDTRFMLQAVMNLNHANFSQVRLDSVNPANLDTGFLQRQYDTVASFIDSDYPTFVSQGYNVSEALFTSWGLNVPGAFIVASPQMISQNPSEITSFLKAYIKGLQFSIANPSAAVADMAKSVPTVNQTIAQLQFAQDVKLMRTPYATSNYGLMNGTELSQAAQLITQAYGVQNVNASNLYTNQYVPSGVSI